MNASSSTHSAEYAAHAKSAYKVGYDKIRYSNINYFLRSDFISDSGEELITKFKNRDKKTKRICAIIRSLDSKLKTSKAPIKVYRGIPMTMFNSIMKQTGVLVNKAYTSSSLSIEVAQNFGKVVLEFTIPVGIKSYVFGNDEDDELEVLIERNTQLVNYRITRQNNLHTYVTADLVKYAQPTALEMMRISKSISTTDHANSIDAVLHSLKLNSDDESSDFSD